MQTVKELLPGSIRLGAVRRLVTYLCMKWPDWYQLWNEDLRPVHSGRISVRHEARATGFVRLGAPSATAVFGNLIGEFSPFDGRADLTANASFSILDKKPEAAGAKTMRDFQLSAQLDVPLGDVEKIGPFVFTMSGKYQHVFSDITTTGATPTTLRKGDLGIGQLKFTIPVKGSGVKIPLSVTFSNRTEFMQESKVRGNIGITFDIDSIFSRLKP